MTEAHRDSIARAVLRNPDRISGLFVMVVAIGALVAAIDLPFGTLRAPDAGFFPRSLSILLAVFGAGIYILSHFRSTEPEGLNSDAWRVFVAAVAFCVYALVLPSVGFVVDTIVVMLLMMRGFGGMSWAPALLVAIPSVVISYFGFTELGVPLPRGILPL